MKEKCENSSDESYEFNSSQSSYEEIQHPNMIKDDKSTQKKKLRGCSRYIKFFDEGIMKPIFIRNHEKESLKKQREFFDVFMKAGTELEADFTNTAILKKKKTLINEATFGMMNIDGKTVDDNSSNVGSHQTFN